MDLKNKVVVITGASKGLGRSLAILLAEEGAKLVLAANDKSGLKELEKDIGGEVFTVDITHENQVQKLAEFAVDKFGRIDAWINNAGVWLPHVSIEEMDMNRVRDLFQTNLFGQIYGSRVALKEMRRQKSGVILNIISVAALDVEYDLSGYVASKFALNGFTKSLRL